ncbi:MAG TPA: hypothetical protein VFA98_04245 [Thermoanaerobaculia bacterium]|nr:hypothetical protein [Thermoanaerobaculia bacterium]
MTTMTPKELYQKILPHALAAYVQKTPDTESAKQMAHAVAKETVDVCAQLGIFDGGIPATAENVRPYAPSGSAPGGTPGIPSFAGNGPGAAGPAPLVPSGSPHQPVQHYNHVAGGEGQAGVMSTVTQVPTPDGYSALGTGGVISHPVQRPSGKDVVVAPGNQTSITQVGGNGTKFVPERIVR